MAGQVGREVTTCDLARRPPQRVDGHARLAQPRLRCTGGEIAGSQAGQQLAAKPWAKRPWLDGGAEASGDCFGRRIRLLSSKTALLDRIVDAVTSRVHAHQAADSAMLIGGDKPSVGARQTLDRLALELWQSDDLVGLDILARIELQAALLKGQDARGRSEP